MSNEYLVTWKINITADSPEEAASQALLIQRDRKSEATFFEVADDNGNTVTVDLDALAARTRVPEGVTIVSMSDVEGVHDAIADAVGGV